MSFLSQYDGAGEDRKPSLVRGWIKNSPDEFFDELRAARPVLVTPGCTLLALHQDVVDVLLQPRVFTVQLYEEKMGSYLMAQDDTPVHFREKAIMRSMLNRDDLPRIRQLVARTAAERLDAAAGKRIDAIAELTRGVPIAIVQEYMGFDGVDPDQLARWSYWNQWDTFHNQPFDRNDNAQEIHTTTAAVNAELRQYLGELVPRRLGEIAAGTDREDVVTRLLRASLPAAVGFPMDRLVRNIGGLLIGTVETTSQASAQALQGLFRRSDELAKARAVIDDPSRFDGYVFEALRFDPISPYLFRRCAEDHVVGRGTAHETTVPADTIVLPLVLSAMFDERAHSKPMDFDPARPRDKMFHFGFGLHECLGRYIGEVTIPEIVRQVLKRPDARPLGAIEYGEAGFPERYDITWA